MWFRYNQDAWVSKMLFVKRDIDSEQQWAQTKIQQSKTGVGKLFGVEGRMSPQGTCCGPDR